MSRNLPKPKLESSLAVLLGVARWLCPKDDAEWLDDMHYELGFVEDYGERLRFVLGMLGLALQLRKDATPWVGSPRSLMVAGATLATLFAVIMFLPSTLKFQSPNSSPTLSGASPEPEAVAETLVLPDIATSEVSSTELRQPADDVTDGGALAEAAAPGVTSRSVEPSTASSQNDAISGSSSLGAAQPSAAPVQSAQGLTEASAPEPLIATETIESADLVAGDVQEERMLESEVETDSADADSIPEVGHDADANTVLPYRIASLSLDPPFVALELKSDTLNVLAVEDVRIETREPEAQARTLEVFNLRAGERQSFTLPVTLHVRDMDKLELFVDDIQVEGIGLTTSALIKVKPFEE